jgi:long-chain fatty acid transport protein
LSGDAYAFGYTGAVLVAPSPRWQVGVSFRSRANADVNDGSADFAVPAPYTSFFPDGEIQTALTLPPSLRTGLMIRPRPDWTVEVDATWTGWSTVDELAINFANGLPRNVTALGWNDSMTYSVGVEHRISSAVRLRGGYLYDPSPIPNAYATPLIPDADRQGLSVGVGFGAVQWSLDVGYQYLWFERVKNNSVGSNASSTTPPIDARANGELRSTAHVVGVSVGHTF